MDEPVTCFQFHPCAHCRTMTLCETNKENCPWRMSARYDLDAAECGALCFTCMENAMASMMQHFGDKDDGA